MLICTRYPLSGRFETVAQRLYIAEGDKGCLSSAVQLNLFETVNIGRIHPKRVRRIINLSSDYTCIPSGFI